MYKNISNTELDALREIGNIGIGNATTALSKMINKKIDIDIPESKIIPLECFAQQVGGQANIVHHAYPDSIGD